jgi:L-threonylcarbamoyladenylate synthase
VIVLAREKRRLESEKHHLVLMPASPDDYARHLYSALRSADVRSPAYILLQFPPATPQWLALRDRIVRAARPL